MVWCGVVTVQCSAVQCSAVQCGGVECCVREEWSGLKNE